MMGSKVLPDAGTDPRAHARLTGKDCQADPLTLALVRIAELNGPIECTSLQDWKRKVQQIALKALNGRK